MSFYINPGELRTPIRIQKQAKTGTGSFAAVGWVDIGNASSTDPPKYIRSRWIASIKGTQTELSDSTQSLDTATVTIRYNSAVNNQCQIIKGGIAYQILDVSDPTQHKQWLQIDVKAAVNS